MIGYLDTSALVPLIVAEPSSAACRRVWDDSDAIVSSRIAYVEAAAALAQAQRLKRLSPSGHRASLQRLAALWDQMDVVEVDQPLVERAAGLARRLGLRGYDAIHCAAAEQLAEPDVLAAAGDQQLLDAWSRVGLATFDTHAS